MVVNKLIVDKYAIEHIVIFCMSIVFHPNCILIVPILPIKMLLATNQLESSEIAPLLVFLPNRSLVFHT